MTDPPFQPSPLPASALPARGLPAPILPAARSKEAAGLAATSRPDPPSVRLVLGTLQQGRRLTGAELREASGLPRRTVYQALRVLRERGVVQMRKSLQDTRQSYFWLAEPVASNDAGADAVAGHAALRFDGGAPAQPAVSSP